MASKQRDVTEIFQVEQVFNKPDGTLPYSYYNPETNGQLVWFCSEDEQLNVVSIFLFEEVETSKTPGQNTVNYKDMKVIDRDRQVSYLKNVEEAAYFRDELVRNGWLPLKEPNIKISSPEMAAVQPNRKQRRAAERNSAKQSAKQSAKPQNKKPPQTQKEDHFV